MTTNTEHRECNRTPIHARTEVRLDNGIVVEGDVQDISLQGFMFHSERRLPIGKTVHVSLIPERTESETGRISVDGFVARLHDEGVAVCFRDLHPDTRQYLYEEVLRGSV